MTTTTSAATFTFDLFENGLDYIKSGISLYFQDDTSPGKNYKYALLHLFSGTLLILKERLRLAHPSLVWADVTHMNNDSNRTVDFDQAVNRLEKCALAPLTAENKALLREVQSIRNKIEHYAFSIDLEKTKNLIGRLVGFLDAFIKTELKKDLTQLVPRDIWMRLSDLEQVARRLEKEHRADWLARADKYRKYGKKRLKALVDAIEPYHPKHNPDPRPLEECPECGHDSIVDSPHDADIALCTNYDCREFFEIKRCERCGSPTLRMTCDDCDSYLSHIMSKDD